MDVVNAEGHDCTAMIVFLILIGVKIENTNGKAAD